MSEIPPSKQKPAISVEAELNINDENDLEKCLECTHGMLQNQCHNCKDLKLRGAGTSSSQAEEFMPLNFTSSNTLSLEAPDGQLEEGTSSSQADESMPLNFTSSKPLSLEAPGEQSEEGTSSSQAEESMPLNFTSSNTVRRTVGRGDGSIAITLHRKSFCRDAT